MKILKKKKKIENQLKYSGIMLCVIVVIIVVLYVIMLCVVTMSVTHCGVCHCARWQPSRLLLCCQGILKGEVTLQN
jgi:hypothetical protein